MDIIKWRESYETGVEEMDEQHKKLIELINTMYRVMRQQQDGAAVDEVLNEMTNYAAMHFQAEEAMLKDKSYHGYESHVALHAEYIKTIERLKSEYQTDPAAAEKKIYTFLRNWWLDHIVKEDSQYGSVLAK